MIVMKFGGTSIANAERVKGVAELIKKNRSLHPVVVVSAHSGMTDALIAAAKNAYKGKPAVAKIKNFHHSMLKELGLQTNVISEQLSELHDLLHGISMTKELSLRTQDYVMSFGERMSSKIIAAYLTKCGIKAKAVFAYDLGIITNSDFGAATPLAETEQNIVTHFRHYGDIPIVTGFIARDKDGEITTLGRNGSDFTASIIGSALGASEIQIWTDCDGVLSADPSIVPDAKLIEELTFMEASELAYFGGRVLHPSTLLPAMKKEIPVRVLNTFRPEGTGTVIRLEASKKRHKKTVRSIVYKEDLTLLNVVSTRMLMTYGFMARLFNTFEKYHIAIDMIATSEVSVSLTTDYDGRDLKKLVEELSEFAEVNVAHKKSVVCLVGTHIKKSPDVVGRIFSLMAKMKINVEMITQGASKINIAFLVDNRDIKRAVNALHKELF